MKTLILFLFFASLYSFSWWKLTHPELISTNARNLASISPEIEIEIEGDLIAIADDMDPDPRKHKIDYFVHDGVKLNPVKITGEVSPSLLGKKVNLFGKLKNGILQGEVALAKGGQVGLQQAPAELAQITDVRKMLVLLFKFQNSKKTFLTKEELEYQMFTGAFQRFFTESTGGRLQHTGKVYDWYELPRVGDAGMGSMICEVSIPEVKQALAFYKINPLDYDSIALISNCTEYTTVGGRANMSPHDFLGIGKKMNLIMMAGHPPLLTMKPDDPYMPGWKGMIPLLVHERGHNLGFFHANGLDCGSSQVLYPCEHVEYGNKYDKMGSSDGAIAFNGDSQLKEGWKHQNEFYHVKNSGVYALDKLTSTRKGRKIGAYIYQAGTNQKLFYIEARKPIGLDNRLQISPVFDDVRDGVLVYSNMNPSTLGKRPARGSYFRIIDPKPTEDLWWADNGHESMSTDYFDPVTGITMRMTSNTNEKAYVEIQYDESARVCGKSTSDQWVSKPFMEFFYIPSSNPKSTQPSNNYVSQFIKQSRIALAPGDSFKLRIQTYAVEEDFCPGYSFTLNLPLPENMKDFVVPRNTGGGGQAPNPGGDGRPDVGQSGPIGGGSGTPNYIYNKSASNVEAMHEFPLMKVPATALNKDYKITFNYLLPGGIIKKHDLYLYIRADRKLPPLSATSSSMSSM